MVLVSGVEVLLWCLVPGAWCRLTLIARRRCCQCCIVASRTMFPD
jgi:hypothetical protein